MDIIDRFFPDFIFNKNMKIKMEKINIYDHQFVQTNIKFLNLNFFVNKNILIKSKFTEPRITIKAKNRLTSNVNLYFYNIPQGMNINILGDNINFSCFSGEKINSSFTIYGNSNVIIGEKTTANSIECVMSNSDLFIKKDCMFSHNITLQTSDQHKVIDLQNMKIKDERCTMTIDEHCWIGKKAIVLKNVHIGKGSIIGASSVVTKNVPPFTCVAGNPAQIIKQKVSWLRRDTISGYESELFRALSL